MILDTAPVSTWDLISLAAALTFLQATQGHPHIIAGDRSVDHSGDQSHAGALQHYTNHCCLPLPNPCLPLPTLAYPCPPLPTLVYPCLPLPTLAHPCHPYPPLPTLAYPGLPWPTLACPCLPLPTLAPEQRSACMLCCKAGVTCPEAALGFVCCLSTANSQILIIGLPARARYC